MGSEGFEGGRMAFFGEEGFPDAGEGFDDRGHLRRTPKVGWRASAVPFSYLWTKGLIRGPLP